MVYLLFLHFGLSTAILPYPSLKTCEEAADYYHEHYGEELESTKCTRIKEEDY